MKKVFIFALLSITVGQLYGILPGEPNPYTTDVRPAVKPDQNLINVRPAQPDPNLINVRPPEEEQALYHTLHPEKGGVYPTEYKGKPITVRPLNKATARQMAE